MRRILITIPLAVLLAVPAEAATPRPGTFKATKIQLGYTMTFKVKGSRITNLVARVLERCDGSTTTTQTTVGPGLSWRIRGGRFSKRIKETQDGVTLYTTLEGRFTSPRKAVGTIRQESIVAGSTCDTLKLKFTATRR